MLFSFLSPCLESSIALPRLYIKVITPEKMVHPNTIMMSIVFTYSRFMRVSSHLYTKPAMFGSPNAQQSKNKIGPKAM